VCSSLSLAQHHGSAHFTDEFLDYRDKVQGKKNINTANINTAAKGSREFLLSKPLVDCFKTFP
jgi:hypothetical protein